MSASSIAARASMAAVVDASVPVEASLPAESTSDGVTIDAAELQPSPEDPVLAVSHEQVETAEQPALQEQEGLKEEADTSAPGLVPTTTPTGETAMKVTEVSKEENTSAEASRERLNAQEETQPEQMRETTPIEQTQISESEQTHGLAQEQENTEDTTSQLHQSPELMRESEYVLTTPLAQGPQPAQATQVFHEPEPIQALPSPHGPGQTQAAPLVPAVQQNHETEPVQAASQIQETHMVEAPEQMAEPPSPTRSASPSPSVTPSMALDAVPPLEHRSVSTPSGSDGSSISLRSRHSRRSDGGATVVHRRGYMRPQGTSFADSARSRDSVMSLGSIAHMQYYFARTGLLDGKGGQLAKSRKVSSMNLREEGDKENVAPGPTRTLSRMSSIYDLGSTTSTADLASSYAISDSGFDDKSVIVESPSDVAPPAWIDPVMLPPTVSTYKVKPEYTEPVPDLPVLRRELKEALRDACTVLEESQKPALIDGAPPAENSGYYEVQGLHLLDIITLAIRAARNYYTAHTAPYKLYAIRSEKVIRADLYQVLDILKRMAARNFRGGVRLAELTEIVTWIESIDKLLKREEAQELADAAERESWVWLQDDERWTGRERERERLFLQSFSDDATPLPEWTAPAPDTTLPTDFLRALQDGQRLVRLHNALVARSKRRFGAIATYHRDVAKPYRMTENLQYWTKAAELRWDVHLRVPLADVVGDKDPAAWRAFDAAVLAWSTAVRTELSEEWRQEARMQERKKLPEVKVEAASDAPETSAVEEPAEATSIATPTPAPAVAV